ncbi:hypothetical protein CPter291_2028 [Collimonas pratensis]|uniref:Uncharacterized protein n=1 Tax=Collimonas pratensis TaxID=279113 RepID=A0ABN4M7R2_9BURK|nr:hypothetical protein CPter291_2028 [Collimonas pratensis]
MRKPYLDEKNGDAGSSAGIAILISTSLFTWTVPMRQAWQWKQ